MAKRYRCILQNQITHRTYCGAVRDPASTLVYRSLDEVLTRAVDDPEPCPNCVWEINDLLPSVEEL